jgi:tetratricopeptide (TPR) repeat protein
MRRPRRLLACLLAIAPVFSVVAPRLAHAQAEAPGGKPAAVDPKLIAQHKRTLTTSPHDGAALASLLGLYRQHRTVELLRDEYQQALDRSPSDWSTLVVLGHIQRALHDDARALECWSRAVAQRPTDAATWGQLGALHESAGRGKDARAAYDKVLANTRDASLKRRALQALAAQALAASDADAANAYYKQLLALEPRNVRLWIERGDAMLAAGKRDLALESYTGAERLLGADPAERAAVVARRGQALEAMGKDDQAVAEYRRAIKLAPKDLGIEAELTGRIVDLYRRKQALPQLITELEQAWPERARGHFEWSTLGKLHEETGAQDKAIAALKQATTLAEGELDTQRRLIQLLENAGKADEAIAQYEIVVRVAPGEARFQLELAERYWRRGDATRARDVLARLQARFPQDLAVLSAIADLQQRWNQAPP